MKAGDRVVVARQYAANPKWMVGRLGKIIELQDKTARVELDRDVDPSLIAQNMHYYRWWFYTKDLELAPTVPTSHERW
jgi:hypothetical protein